MGEEGERVSGEGDSGGRLLRVLREIDFISGATTVRKCPSYMEDVYQGDEDKQW